MPRSHPRSPPLPDGTYVELVRSVFSTLTPTTIMGILFTVVATWTVERSSDLFLITLGWLGIALSITRVALLLVHEAPATTAGPGRARARTAERRFAAAYLSFALVLGLFGARVFQLPDQGAGVVMVALLVGYSAGVAAGVSLRPWIALPSVALAVAPTIAVTIASADASQRLLGFVLGCLLFGGAGSMVARFRSEAEKITMRRAFQHLTRHDALTGLENRVGLSECYDEVASVSRVCLNAVHCLDLDRFKAVNDDLGHPAGDALLRAVASRLGRLLRKNDIAARLGGDEFAILQTGLAHADEAELLARRIARSLTEPYSIDGATVSIGVSIGFVVSTNRAEALDDLLAIADRGSYDAKRRGGGVVEGARGRDRAVAG